MVGKILGVIIGAVVIGNIVVAVWSTFVGTDTAVQALVETDVATVTLKAMWPVFLVVTGIGIVAGCILWGLKALDIMD